MRDTPEYNRAKDKLSQPFSAKLAIRQGKLFGKGPGESTQRYVVSIMYSDYMYSFIIEEYGLIGALLITVLSNIMNMQDITTYVQDSVKGVVLILAILLNNIIRERVRV